MHTEIYGALLIPVAVLVVFAWIKEILRMDDDDATDLILAILVFDLAFAFGLLPNISNYLHSNAPDVLAMARIWPIATFFLGVGSLLIRKYTVVPEPPFEGTERVRFALLRAAGYMPAVLAVALHIAPWESQL